MVKNMSDNAGDVGSIPDSGRSPGQRSMAGYISKGLRVRHDLETKQ